MFMQRRATSGVVAEANRKNGHARAAPSFSDGGFFVKTSAKRVRIPV
jgi:hypothetical protein